MARILVSGSLGYDRIMDFPGYFRDHFVEGKLHNINVCFTVDTFEESFGGTAGNIAYTLALLSEEPRIISTAGGDFEPYRAWLAARGVDVSSIAIAEEERTAAAYIVTDEGDNQITAFHGGAGERAYDLPIPDDATFAIISPGSTLDMRALPARYKAAGLSYFYDPGQRIPVLDPDELREAITGSAGLFVNDYELGLVAEKTGWDEEELLERTKMLIVTFGENGSGILTPDGETKIAVVPASTVADPTGAGDAYRAGFLKGLAAELPLPTVGRLASTVASFAVEKQGTQSHHFTLPELAERYEHAFGTSLNLT